MRSHQLLAHTADIGLAIAADDLVTLFDEAAHGLLHLLGGRPLARVQQELVVEITGFDTAELFVNWLNELLFQLETRHFYPADFRIERLTSTELRAVLRGEALDPDRHSFAREAKAVTHHQLLLEKTTTGWRARVYIDL